MMSTYVIPSAVSVSDTSDRHSIQEGTASRKAQQFGRLQQHTADLYPVCMHSSDSHGDAVVRQRAGHSYCSAGTHRHAVAGCDEIPVT